MKKFIRMVLLAAALISPALKAQEVTSILQVLDTKTGKIRVVQEFPYLIEAPNWTHDGKWLIYNTRGQIWRISPDGGESTQVPTGEVMGCNNDHVLSADGKQIAVSAQTASLRGSYCAERNGNYDVYTIPAAGGEETRLTTADDLDDGPEYSPDGKYIWFNSVRSGLMQVWRMRADGSDQRQMTFDEDLNSWFPHVSPDGKKVVFIAYHKGDLKPNEHLANKNVVLRMMTAKGKKVRTIHTLFGGQGTINVNSWAPDSRHIAFVSYRLP